MPRSQPLAQRGPCRRPQGRHTRWGLSGSSPRAVPQGKSVATGTPPRLGGQAAALHSSARGGCAAGVPSHRAVHAPDFKGQGRHQREEEERDEIRSPRPTSAPLLRGRRPSPSVSETRTLAASGVSAAVTRTSVLDGPPPRG